jgi:hypothetical protein
MIDDFFQKQPLSPSFSLFKGRVPFFFRCLFYTSILGFIAGSVLGYLHIKGWVKNAEEGLVLYGMTFGIGAVLSIAFVFYQSRQHQLKTEKIRRPNRPHS